MNDFPPELVDQIIDHLHNDAHSLAACSLVCRKWQDASWTHLFSAIRVKLSSQKFTQFLLDLQSGSFQVAKYIRRLTIQGVSSRPAQIRAEVALSTLSSILQCLPHLVSLSLMEISPRLSTHEMIPSPRINIPKLTLGGTNGTGREIFALLSLFSEVQTLHLGWIVWDVASNDLPVDEVKHNMSNIGISLDIKVHTLMVNCASPSHVVFFGIFKNPSLARHLRVIHAYCEASCDIVALGELLRVAGPQLSHLHLDLAYAYRLSPGQTSSQSLQQVLSLSSCTQLTSVSIVVAVDTDDEFDSYGELVPDPLNPDRYTICTVALDILSVIPPSTVSEIALSMELVYGIVPFLQHSREMDWSRLERTVRTYPALRSLNFRFRDSSHLEKDGEQRYLISCNTIVEKLPSIANQGMLQFERRSGRGVIDWRMY